MARVVIFANGEVPDYPRAGRLLLPQDVIMCADGGTRHAFQLDVPPSVVIGDLDSIPESQRPFLEAARTSFIRHPRDKDETDLELALSHALAQKPDRLLLIGALGRRLDQTLGNISLLTGRQFESVDARLDDGTEAAFFCRARQEIHGAPADLVSLLPWTGDVQGVTTRGLRWPLHAETLRADRTRGISNELLSDSASVAVESGLLLIVHHRLSF